MKYAVDYVNENEVWNHAVIDINIDAEHPEFGPTVESILDSLSEDWIKYEMTIVTIQ